MNVDHFWGRMDYETLPNFLLRRPFSRSFLIQTRPILYDPWQPGTFSEEMCCEVSGWSDLNIFQIFITLFLLWLFWIIILGNTEKHKNEGKNQLYPLRWRKVPIKKLNPPLTFQSTFRMNSLLFSLPKLFCSYKDNLFSHTHVYTLLLFYQK